MLVAVIVMIATVVVLYGLCRG